MKKNFPGWRCHFLTGDPDFQKQFGLKASKKIPIMNGDIDCRALEYQIIASFNRKEKPGAREENETQHKKNFL